jgi:hypothetical protein
VWTRARLQVDTVYKGADDPSELIIDQVGGRFGTHATEVASTARFSPYEEVLIFLDTNQTGTRLSPVAMFLGKYTIRRAPGDARQHLLRVSLGAEEHYDARFLPHPALEDRLYLDDVLEQVERRLDVGWDGVAIPGIAVERLRTINTPERRRR